MVKLATCEHSEWQRVEREMIATLRASGRLTNLTAGGEGIDMPRTPEWRARIGQAHRGKSVSGETQQRLRDLEPREVSDLQARSTAWTAENTAVIVTTIRAVPSMPDLRPRKGRADTAEARRPDARAVA